MAAFRLFLLILALGIIAVVYEWSILDKLIIALVALLAVAWLLSRGSLNRLGLRRTLSTDRVRVGDDFHEEITLTNHSRLPRLWIEVQDQSTLANHNAGAVVSLRGKGSSTWHTQTRAVRRGTYRLGPFTVHAGDPFGLFQQQRLIPVSHELVVYPPAIDVSRIRLPLATMTGGSAHHPHVVVSSPSVASLRDYQPGDPLNRISWTATARRGQMMVKELDPDPTADLWIILDLSERGQFDLDPPRNSAGNDGDVARYLDTTVEYIVAIGGSLAERALNDGRKVGMVINRAMPVRLDADNTQRQWFRIFEVLANAQAFGNRSLVEALSAESRRFNRTTGVVVVTSDPEPDWTFAARTLVQRRIPVSAVVVDTGSAGEDDVQPLIEALAGAHVDVTRYPAHTATRGYASAGPQAT